MNIKTLLFAFSFFVSGVSSNLIAMEQQQFPGKSIFDITCGSPREKLMIDSGNSMEIICCDCFHEKWCTPANPELLVETKEDGCIVGCLVNKEVLTARCDSWLKILIGLQPKAEVTFSADAVMFMNGEFGRHEYTQTFKNMYGMVEFTLPVAENCHMTVDYTSDMVNTFFTLVPMEIVSTYSERKF